MVVVCLNIAAHDGDHTFLSWPEAEAFLRNCAANKPDELWLSGDTDYPCPAIMVNGQYACVHYFLNDNGDMWQSVGHEEQDVTFIAGGVDTEMPGSTVISTKQAIDCARQFFDSIERPDCIEWFEL